MRLDKYLKVSRLIKRRTVAKDACDGGKIAINGKVAKASSVVVAGDEITIAFGAKTNRYRVIKIKEQIKKEEASEMYTPII